MQRKYGDLISDTRGIGLTLNLTMNNKSNRDALVQNLLKRHGIYVQKAGETSVALRPSLWAESSYLELFYKALRIEFDEY